MQLGLAGLCWYVLVKDLPGHELQYGHGSLAEVFQKGILERVFPTRGQLISIEFRRRHCQTFHKCLQSNNSLWDRRVRVQGYQTQFCLAKRTSFCSVLGAKNAQPRFHVDQTKRGALRVLMLKITVKTSLHFT